MKTKIMLILGTGLLLSTAVFAVASAKSLASTSVQTKTDVELKTQEDDSSGEIKTEVRSNSTSTREQDEHEATSSEESEKGELDGEAHRSGVATFVKSLLSVADREGGIGAEVRVIAREQNDSASTSAETITKIKSRNGLLKLLFGEDYKSLGKLRSEIVKTQNNLDKLRSVLALTTDVTVKAELSAQIKVLEDLRTAENVFVTAHENSFSFLGWFVKMFNK